MNGVKKYNNSTIWNLVVLDVQEDLISVTDDGHRDGHCSMGGIIGSVFQIAAQKLIDKGIKCTAFGDTNIGVMDPVSKKYDGALGHVQGGVADFLMMPTYFPLEDLDDNFIYTPILHADTMTMFTAYDVNTSTHEGDIFSMFANIPRGLYIGYVISFLTFVMVSYLGSKLLNEMYGSFWMTVCAFLDQDNFPTTSSKFLSVMSFMVMLGMFLMTTYVCSSMSTELTTIEKPFAVTTYEQILERNMTTAFTTVLPEWEKFSSAPNGSTEQKMFQKKKIVHLNPQIGQEIDQFMNQSQAFVSRPFVARATALVFMALPGVWPPTGRAFVAPDPRAKTYSNVFVLSSKWKDTYIFNYLCVVVTRMGEHGFATYVQERIVSTIVSTLVQTSLPSHEQWITSKVEEQSPDLTDIGWSHVRRTFVMVSIGLLFSAIILVAEHLILNHFKPRKCRQQIMIERRWYNSCRRERKKNEVIEGFGNLYNQRRMDRTWMARRENVRVIVV